MITLERRLKEGPRGGLVEKKSLGFRAIKSGEKTVQKRGVSIGSRLFAPTPFFLGGIVLICPRNNKREASCGARFSSVRSYERGKERAGGGRGKGKVVR